MDINIEEEKNISSQDEQVSFFHKAIAYRGGLIMVVLAAAILAVGYFIFLSPQTEGIIAKKTEITTTEENIEKLNEQLTRFKRLKREYDSVDQVKIDKVEDLVTATPDLPNLYIQVDELITRNDLVVESISAEPQTDKNAKNETDLGVVDISVQVSGGSYAKLKKMLVDLQNNLRILDIKSLSFPEDISSFNLELSAYYIK